ncbi:MULTISPECIES: hypothetical protein [Tistrella]|jgi:hypothetical protein|nr:MULTISPECIES: hypothetical protein [Tistrella]|tara:strand:+ start:163 stop:285 length:123 start_codon:yes stop_codon:yes gene_type:complete
MFEPLCSMMTGSPAITVMTAAPLVPTLDGRSVPNGMAEAP